jgi:endonuclease III-like uncharacterized protein
MSHSKILRNPVAIVIPLICLLMAGCGKSDEQELNDDLRGVVSSSATVIVIGESWSNGLVPQAYTYRTFESMSVELQKELDEIDSLSNATNEQKEIVKRVQSLVSNLSSVVRKQNRAAVIQPLDQLKDQYTALSSLTSSIPKE